MSILIVADDLSGAAETAGAFTAVARRAIEVRLGPATGALVTPVAIDTHTRGLRPDEAYDVVAGLLIDVAPGTLVYKKVDSLLRGNIAAELRAILDSGRRAVVASAVPRVGRTVSGGVVHVHGQPLHRTAAWSAESGPAPRSLPGLLDGATEVIPVDVVRSAALDCAIRSVLARHAVPVCDAEDQEDLDAIARAIVALDEPVAAVGAGGLARSLAALVSLDRVEIPSRNTPERVCVVVGSRSPAAAAQVRALVAQGVHPVEFGPGALAGLGELGSRDCVVTPSEGAVWTEDSLSEALHPLAERIQEGGTGLVLTGGSTARAVLECLGVDRLYVECELEDGVVLSTTPDGVAVATKPGSFGDDQCLLRAVDAVKGRE